MLPFLRVSTTGLLFMLLGNLLFAAEHFRPDASIGNSRCSKSSLPS